jgi:hypothetical protein
MWFFPKAYPIELVHLTFSLVGLSVNVITVAYAIGDLLHITTFRHTWPVDEGKYRSFIAHRNLREESVRLALNAIFVSIGIVSIFNAPPSTYSVSEDLTFQLRYTRIALTGGSLFLTFKSVKDLTDRRWLQTMMRKEHSFNRG